MSAPKKLALAVGTYIQTPPVGRLVGLQQQQPKYVQQKDNYGNGDAKGQQAVGRPERLRDRAGWQAVVVISAGEFEADNTCFRWPESLADPSLCLSVSLAGVDYCAFLYCRSY
jgi:hypothetical protein